MKKRLFSLLLAAALAGSAVPVGAVDLAEEDSQSILVVEEADSADTAMALSEEDSQDPEAYRATHRMTRPEEEQEVRLDGVRALAGTTISSIYTNKTYRVPTGVEVTQGLDVSKWDDVINWSKVAKAGTEFAIVRVGYTGYGNGKQVLDPKFEDNITGAAKVGIPAGVYIYSQATTKSEARAEANFCLDAIKGYDVTLPIVMDVEFAEDSNGFTGRLYEANLTKSEQTNVCLAFCETIAEAGYTPMIYANKSMLTSNMNADTISAKYPIWLAHYTTETTYSGEYDFWQYSETGSVSGIDYPVDCNFGFDISKLMNNGSVSATKVELNQSEKEIEIGSSFTLKATVTPSDSTDSVKWSSSDTSVATVSSSGKVKAVGVGTAKIKAKAGAKSASCTVTVTPAATSLTELRATALGNVKATWAAADGATKYFVYRSEIGKSGTFHRVASTTKTYYKDTDVDHGNTYYYRVKSVRDIGEQRYSSKVSATENVVAGVGTTAVTMSATEATLEITGQAVLEADVAPLNASEPIKWKTSDSSVASVSDGTITAKGVGTATITASSDGCSASCTVTVTPKRTAINSLERVRSGSVSLSWKTSSGAERYYVYRSTTGVNGSFHLVKSTKKTSLTEKELTKGEQYYYRVSAVKTVDDVRYKSKVSATKTVVA